MIYWVSKCPQGHTNLWTPVTRPKVGDHVHCYGCARYRRVVSMEKQ